MWFSFWWKSCFERDLKIIVQCMFCYVFLNFASVFLKNWTLQSTSCLFMAKISYYKNICCKYSMKLIISNPIEAIYLDVFALSQNIEFQIMSTWVHSLQIGLGQRLIWNLQTKKTFLYFKNEKKMIKLLQHQYDITRLYRCLIDVEDNKDLMDNFI